MTEKQMKEIEDFYINSNAMISATEDDAERRYYQGELMGIKVVLDMLGYILKEDGVKVKFIPDLAKSIECKHYKVVKRPWANAYGD